MWSEHAKNTGCGIRGRYMSFGILQRLEMLRLSSGQHAANGREDVLEHPLGEAAGLGVLLARVVGGNEGNPTGQVKCPPVAEYGPRYYRSFPPRRELVIGDEVSIEGNSAKSHHHPQPFERTQLLQKIGPNRLPTPLFGACLRGARSAGPP